jgi:hypothetical protein
LLALNVAMGFDFIELFANKLTIPKFQPLARHPGKKKGGLGHPVLAAAVSMLWHHDKRCCTITEGIRVLRLG